MDAAVANSTSPITFGPIHQFDQPVQDEWGIFDPRQAGVEALLRKLLTPAGDRDIAPKPPAPVAK